MPSLAAQMHPLASPKQQLQLLDAIDAPDFEAVLQMRNISALVARDIQVLQVNLGKLCNQTCAHCHVDAGPNRTEIMTRDTAEQVIEVLRRNPIPTLDLTGGAPELIPQFRWLVQQARGLGRRVIDRCNLTVLLTASHADLIPFLASHRVEIMASLPSYRGGGTDAQRGAGVFLKSIEALRRLNAAGYGGGAGLILNLIHNPVGAFLPGNQASLEREYKRELRSRHGVVFDRLFTITNMPISRYLEYLARTGNLQSYLDLLVASFNAEAAEGVMCRTYLSVGWDGTLYDCDFNQMLDMSVDHGAPKTLAALLESGIPRRRIRTGKHCFGCTAGAGSSCGGATA